MSKFCGQCGSENLDDAVSCVNCGNAFEDLSNQVTAVNNTPKENKSKLMVLIGAGVAAVIIIAVILILLLGGGAKKAVENLVCATEDGDFKVISESAPEDIIRDLEKKYNVDLDDVIEYSEKQYKDMIDNSEEMYGDDFSIKCEVIDEIDMFKNDFKSLKNDLKENYDISKSDVTDAKICCVKIVAEGEDGGYVLYDEYYTVKIDGDWYVVDASGVFMVEDFFEDAAENDYDFDYDEDYEFDIDDYDDYSDDYDFDFNID